MMHRLFEYSTVHAVVYILDTRVYLIGIDEHRDILPGLPLVLAVKGL